MTPMDYENYFEYRQVNPRFYEGFKAPPYLLDLLGARHDARILDFGCGFGQLSFALRNLGFACVEGLDIAPPAIQHSRAHGLICHDGGDAAFFQSHESFYDYIIVSHVVEHFPKDEIVALLDRIRRLLKPSGVALIIVPNAQANTGAYWAYEDFTHHTLFTSGSLYYVLRQAGFTQVDFLDAACTAGLSWHKKAVKLFLLMLYKWNYKLWNRVTSSVLHAPSPPIFSFEIKAAACVAAARESALGNISSASGEGGEVA